MIDKPLLEFTSRIFRPFGGQENVVLSPMSIHTALNMVLLGADEGSETKNELLQALGFKHLDDEQINKCFEEYSTLIDKFKKLTKESRAYQKKYNRRSLAIPGRRQNYKLPISLSIFNTIITRDGGNILPEYEQSLQKYFDSSILKVDHKKPETKKEVLKKVNSWAKESGFNQIIEERELHRSLSAILLSAICIEGNWFREFDEGDGNETCFHNLGKKNQPVRGVVLSQNHPIVTKYLELTSIDRSKYKFLHKKSSKSRFGALFAELSTLDTEVAEVGLEANLSFSIFAPCKPSGQGGELDALVDRLMQPDEASGPNKLEKVFSLLDDEFGDNPIENISFPKFGFRNNIDLKEHLQSIGVKLAFCAACAELGNAGSDQLCIEMVTHQAMIDVNKFGIKAGAVTKMLMTFASLKQERFPIEVHIKHPFLFVIRYEKLPLFIGRLDRLDQ